MNRAHASASSSSSAAPPNAPQPGADANPRPAAGSAPGAGSAAGATSGTSGGHSRPPRTARRRWLTFRSFLLLVVLLITALVSAGLSLRTTRWVEAPGYLMTDLEVEIRPSVEGAIDKDFAHSGQEVKEGEVLIQLNDSVQRASYEQASSELAARQAELQQLRTRMEIDSARRREQIYQAEQELELSLRRLKRMEEAIARGGGFAQTEIDDAKLKADMSRSRLTELRLPVENVWQEQAKVMEELIQSAMKKVALHEAELKVRQIRAPLSGIVYFNRYEPGEVVKPDHVLGQIFGKGVWVVKLKVPERHIGFVQVGQDVLITTSAYPSYRFDYLKAKVSRILPVVTPRATGDGIFYIEAQLKPPFPYDPQPGLSALAYIDAGECSWLTRIIGW